MLLCLFPLCFAHTFSGRVWTPEPVIMSSRMFWGVCFLHALIMLFPGRDGPRRFYTAFIQRWHIKKRLYTTFIRRAQVQQTIYYAFTKFLHEDHRIYQKKQRSYTRSTHFTKSSHILCTKSTDSTHILNRFYTRSADFKTTSQTRV